MWQVTQCQLPKETYSCPYPLFQRMQLKGHEVSTNRVDCHLISDLQLIGTPFQKSQTGPDKEMHGQWNKHWQDTGTGAETDMARTLVQIPTWHMIRRPVQRLTWHGHWFRHRHGKDTGSDTDMTHDTETGAETDMTRGPVQRLTWQGHWFRHRHDTWYGDRCRDWHDTETGAETDMAPVRASSGSQRNWLTLPSKVLPEKPTDP